ncbi:MAG: MXAN_2562 family outer membrane beta-barrel protein [Myxococcales bacterium]|jgi:hypothetical protein
MKRMVTLAAVLLAPSLALGQESLLPSQESLRAGPIGASSRNWTLELNGGRFRPPIDEEPGLKGSPYNDIFGKKSMWLFEGELDYKLVDLLGPLSLGLAGGYGVVWGRGIAASDGKPAPDTTTLSTVPVRLLAVYRFQWLNNALGIPLVPFVKAGMAYTFWWITNGAGDVAKFGENKALGGKWGYELAGGLAFELNFIDREAARDLDQQWGVNSVLLQAQYARLTADNFGGEGMDLSDDAWLFGLAFEF